ncbi:MAG TPA: methyltransferase domain-containing protein [Pyrinomonadaceae bacterium]|nr:methyltransferase domain-containing protein [Pyrinomonadaceae bacterium]
MKRSVLEYLACPSCGGDIKLASTTEEEGIEILTGRLECTSCRKTFSIVRGVPRFADLPNLEEDKRATAESFGWSWQEFSQEDAKYAQQFLDWIAPVTADFFAGKVVLEGGCGKGRHTRRIAGWGAKDIVAVDLSDAVEVAFAATRDLPNAHIIQADIFHLPLRRVFDYAFSVGVLHHLPNPREGFNSLVSKVKSGGHMSAWVYGAENNGWIVSLVNPVRRVTSSMNRRGLFHLSKIPTAAMYLATKLVYRPLNRSQTGAKVARHLFYNEYLNYISRFNWREQHTIVFDHLVAPTAFYISREEFADWWRDVGAEDVTIAWHNQNSWRGFGRLSR